jgi:hypothetical protein
MTRAVGVLNPEYFGKRFIPPRVAETEEEWRARCKHDPIAKAVDEKIKQMALAETRCKLANVLMEILYDDICAETAAQQGTESTHKTYRSDFGRFQRWASQNDLPALPSNAETVAHYILSEAKTNGRPEGLQRSIQAIAFTHKWADQPFDPNDVLIKAVMRFVKRSWEEELEKRAETPELAVERKRANN